MPTPIFSLPVRVYIEDTDTNGIVYHANYLRYIERARTEWLRTLGYNRARIQAMGIMLVVRKLHINYLAPARLDDSLVSTVRSFRLQPASIGLCQEIYCLHHDDEKHINSRNLIKLCDAYVQIACIDGVRLKPRRFAKIGECLNAKYPAHQE